MGRGAGKAHLGILVLGSDSSNKLAGIVFHSCSVSPSWLCARRRLRPRLSRLLGLRHVAAALRPAARSVGITTLARVRYARLRKCRMGTEAQLWTAMYRRCCAGYYWNYNSLQGTIGYYGYSMVL